ncbi:MAG: cation:proton antiporter [Alphaproteobacteria bacterium]|nr:cation:proton antiporter [Alphaproteobacteria bacterium]
MHNDFNLTEIALVALAALGCGVLLERFKQPAVLGYILAGVILGPSMLAMIESREQVTILAELGVLMLLFLVGMELDFQDFKKVWHISLLCTLLQIFGCLLVMLGVGKIFHIPLELTVLLACAIALSSTAVAVKMLEGINELTTPTGQLTIGILIAQDLAVVPMMLILKDFNSGQLHVGIIIQSLLSIGILGVLIFYLSRRERIRLPFENVVKGHEDLLPLLSLAFCFCLAALSGLIGLSAAYGSFLAGLILGNTTAHDSLLQSTKPIQSILMMVFFLSIGLLMDLQYIWQHIWQVLLLLSFITVGKSLLNITVLHILGQPWSRSFLSGLILAQMGEFAFLLTSVGTKSGLIDADGQRLVISLAALSLAFSPLWLAGARRIITLGPKEAASFQEIVSSIYGAQIRNVGVIFKGVSKIMRYVYRSLKFRVGQSSKDKSHTKGQG